MDLDDEIGKFLLSEVPDQELALLVPVNLVSEIISGNQKWLQSSTASSSEVANIRLFTGDGSVDINGNPSLKLTTGKWKACSFIIVTEFCERLAYYGISKNLISYLTRRLHEGNVAAARNVTTWQASVFVTPLIGAFLADSYWGKFWTIAIFCTIYLLGMVTLTISASVAEFMPSTCIGSDCPEERSAHSVVFFIGLYMIALGAGGIKPCVASFAPEQFDDTNPAERAAKDSFFNWSYFVLNAGSLISGTVLVWIQDNCGWGLGFAIPTFSMGIAIIAFFIGSRLYRFQKPGGNPFARVCQIIVASLRKWNTELPEDSSSLYNLPGNTSEIEKSRKLEHTADFKFLDKAAVMTDVDTKYDPFPNPWRLCTVRRVEELKILIRMFPIWAANVMFYAVYVQNSSMFLEQGMAMDKRIGSFNIPPASLSTFDVISCMIWVPIYDRVIVPIARRFTGKERGISELQRMGIGLLLSILAMAAAALVEMKRLDIAESHGLIHEKVEVPMSILWQIPQFSLVGAGEIFATIGLFEFFYNESPVAMRSMCCAFALLTISIGGYLSSIILTVVNAVTARQGSPGWAPDNLNEGHLDRFFWLIAGLSFLNLLIYSYCAAKYKSKGVHSS